MNQSRIKNTSQNLIFTVIFQVIKIALGFIGRIIFVRQLGVEYLGVNGLFTNVLSILSLADLGMATTLMYSLYKPLADKDEQKIKQYMNYFKKIYNIIALAVAVIGICLIPFLKYIINLPNDMPHIYLYYILILLNSVVSYLFVYRTTLLSTDQKMYVVNKYDIVFQIILFFLQTIILFATRNFTLYLISNIVCTLIFNILKVRATERIYPFLKEKTNTSLAKSEQKQVFRNMYSLFFYKLGGVIQSNTDNILISIFVGTITVGYYSNYSTIILAVTSFLTLMFASVKASVGNFVIEKNEKEQSKMFNILETYNFWLVGFCSICLMVLLPDFIFICFGKEYLLSFGLLVFVVLNFYTSNIRQVLWIYRETTGIFKKTKFITMITSIINIILSLVFGYYMGLVGIVFATVVARMVYAWWREVQIIYRDCFHLSPQKYYFTYIKRLILVIMIYAIIEASCYLLPTMNIYIHFIIKAMICFMISIFMIILIYRKSEAFDYFKNNILKVIKRKGK